MARVRFAAPAAGAALAAVLLLLASGVAAETPPPADPAGDDDYLKRSPAAPAPDRPADDFGLGPNQAAKLPP